MRNCMFSLLKLLTSIDFAKLTEIHWQIRENSSITFPPTADEAKILRKKFYVKHLVTAHVIPIKYQSACGKFKPKI